MKQYTTQNNSEKPELPCGLYIVATPIGNLRDITLRALDVLTSADVILCEDTRVTRKLLAAFQIKAKTQAYHDHSDDNARDKIIDLLKSGQSVALVSDAGMPLISDPGYKLVQACNTAGIPVTTLPGANAPLAALQLSGLPTDKFSFIGFIPVKSKAKKNMLREWMNIGSTLIAFETAPRLEDTLAAIEECMGDRMIVVVREITKMFEEVRRGAAHELLDFYRERGTPKGEIVIVIAPPGERVLPPAEVESLLYEALKTMKTKDAAAHVSKITGVSKSDLYTMALEVTKK